MTTTLKPGKTSYRITAVTCPAQGPMVLTMKSEKATRKFTVAQLRKMGLQTQQIYGAIDHFRSHQ